LRAFIAADVRFLIVARRLPTFPAMISPGKV
jgi:hypothetical protein